MREEIRVALILILIIINFSCKQEKDNENTQYPEFTTINVNLKKIEKDNNILSIFADSITYIPLETRDNFLIGNIDKIMVEGNDLFILDKLTEAIFCFDITNGKFRYKIDKKGGGPDEYISITSFSLTSKGEVVVYSSSEGLLFYKNGEMTENIKSSIIASDFYIDQSDSLYFYTGRLPNEHLFKDFPKQYRLIKVSDDSVIQEYLPYKYSATYLQFPVPNYSSFLVHDTLNIVDYMNQETYSISNDTLKAKYKFIFTTNSNTFNFNNSEELNKSIIEKSRKSNYTRLGSYIESKGYIFITYNVENFVLKSYIRKEGLEINNIGLFYYDDFNNIPFGGNILYSTGNEIIASIEPGIFLSLLENKDDVSSTLQELEKNVGASDNPIIIKVKLKE